MKTPNFGSLSLLLISCVLSTSLSLPLLAADGGVIVIQRTVQGHMAGRSPGVDPNPDTVNANATPQILRATGELADSDFAGVSSGAGITRSILPGGNLPGLSHNSGGAGGLGAGNAAGISGGGSASLGSQINGSISRGMAPLNNINKLMGGQ